ncbi:MAG: AAA domain-containing protein [Gammaproteobacteria bacterium]|nr:AAA domain-containing protein [Gammaproteobacteria bacterium]
MTKINMSAEISMIATSETSLSAEVAEIILDAVQLAATSPDIEMTVGGILRLLDERLSLTKGRVLQKDFTDGHLHVSYAHGLSRSEIEQAVYAVGEGLTGRIFKTGKSVVVSETGQAVDFEAGAPVRPVGRDIAYIAVPILWNDGVVGVLAAQSPPRTGEALSVAHYVMRIMAGLIGQVLCIHRMVAAQIRQLRRENERLRRMDSEVDGAVHGIVGKSPALRRALADAAKAATSSATVMLIGESGCGKERFSRMIHLASERRDAPFVCINCAAIPHNLLESELFGYEKGSFTGATTTRKGTFEQAAGGTLFLDEIGDMPVDLQAKLLRVLQERTVQRIGGSQEIPVDVRIICATNRQMDEAIRRGDFRLDLYYRLNVLPILLPPLRERDGDIELLSLYFLARYNQKQRRNVTFSSPALKRLEEYEWPGNVRQLENFIERLVIMSDEELITPDGIDSMMLMETPITIEDLKSANDDEIGAEFEWQDNYRPYRRVRHDDRDAIIDAMRKAQGNKTQAAKRLGLSTRQLHYRLNKLKIES